MNHRFNEVEVGTKAVPQHQWIYMGSARQEIAMIGTVLDEVTEDGRITDRELLVVLVAIAAWLYANRQ